MCCWRRSRGVWCIFRRPRLLSREARRVVTINLSSLLLSYSAKRLQSIKSYFTKVKWALCWMGMRLNKNSIVLTWDFFMDWLQKYQLSIPTVVKADYILLHWEGHLLRRLLHLQQRSHQRLLPNRCRRSLKEPILALFRFKTTLERTSLSFLQTHLPPLPSKLRQKGIKRAETAEISKKCTRRMIIKILSNDLQLRLLYLNLRKMLSTILMLVELIANTFYRRHKMFPSM